MESPETGERGIVSLVGESGSGTGRAVHSPGGDTPPAVKTFIARWAASGAAERANYQLFLSERAATGGYRLR